MPKYKGQEVTILTFDGRGSALVRTENGMRMIVPAEEVKDSVSEAPKAKKESKKDSEDPDSVGLTAFRPGEKDTQDGKD